MHLSYWLRRLRRVLIKIDPLVEIKISRTALLHNYSVYRQVLPQTAIAPVLKSNAYGHGIVEVASILQNTDAPFFVVDSLFEVRQLRQAGITKPLLVIGYVPVEHMVKNTLSDVIFTLIDITQVRRLESAKMSVLRVHLKFDTGMHRQGLSPEDVIEAGQILKQLSSVKVEGICTHLGDADNTDNSRTVAQIKKWQSITEKWSEYYGEVQWKHFSATNGVRFVSSENSNLARIGIGMYGVVESPSRDFDLRPVLSMQTVISSLRWIKPGESVGYNATYTAQTDRHIATVPVGYFEGIDRRLSNKGFFSVNGTICPIVGRVSMNITSIDVTKVARCQVGGVVMVIGDKSEDDNSVVAMARQAEVIPYEIIAHIPAHLRRTVID